MESLLLLKQIPKVIIFDCDACLWNPECFELSSAPTKYHKENKYCYNQNGDKVYLFNDVYEIFQFIKENFNETKIALASSTRYPNYSIAIQHLFVMNDDTKLVDNIAVAEIYPKNKKVHFKNIKEKLKVKYTDMVFFDDNNWSDNVSDALDLQIEAIATPNGLTIELFVECLENYNSKTS